MGGKAWVLVGVLMPFRAFRVFRVFRVWRSRWEEWADACES